MPEALADVPMVLWLAGALALLMAWAIGANDVANAMGTSVGSGALTFLGAVVLAGVLEFGGAFLVGGHVTHTIRKGIIELAAVEARPEFLTYGMLAALAAAAIWLFGASWAGWPVSTTHSIVGAIVGFACVAFGPGAVVWAKVGQIVASWLISPVLGGALAFVIFRIVQRSILDADRPGEAAKRVGPAFVFVVVFVLALVTLFKGLKNLRLDLPLDRALLVATVLGLVAAAVSRSVLRRTRTLEAELRDEAYRDVERVFGVLQVMTAGAVAFAHGSNDVANAIGPLAAIFQTASAGAVTARAAVPTWMLALGGLGIVLGLATYGYRVIETVGRRITELTPTRGFSAELAAAMTIVAASKAGIPVSTTHTLVGSVLGVGVARGIGALDLAVVRRILFSWAATVPTGAALAAFFFYFFKGLLGP